MLCVLIFHVVSVCIFRLHAFQFRRLQLLRSHRFFVMFKPFWIVLFWLLLSFWLVGVVVYGLEALFMSFPLAFSVYVALA